MGWVFCDSMSTLADVLFKSVLVRVVKKCFTFVLMQACNLGLLCFSICYTSYSFYQDYYVSSLMPYLGKALCSNLKQHREVFQDLAMSCQDYCMRQRVHFLWLRPDRNFVLPLLTCFLRAGEDPVVLEFWLTGSVYLRFVNYSNGDISSFTLVRLYAQ